MSAPPPSEPAGSEARSYEGSGRFLTRFEIDRRPIGVVLLDRLWKQLVLAALLGAFAVAVGLEPPAGLTPAGWKSLCIFALSAVLWATALLPLAITSLLAMSLVPLLGIMPASKAYGFFGSKVVFFMLGALMLSAAMIRSGLSTRLATAVVRRFGATPRRLVMAIFLLCAGGSMLMNEHAVAVMVLPIVVDTARALNLQPLRSPLGRALCFALAWGCIIGGSLTVLGGSRGPLAIGILEEATHGATTISFVDYIVFGAPMVLLMLVAGALLLRFRFTPEVTDTAEAVATLERRAKQLGKLSARELVVALIMTATVLSWAFVGDAVGLDTIAIFAMAALFALRAVSWAEVESEVSWGVVLMYGGAISLSAAMSETGAALWLAEHVFSGAAGSPTALLIVVALLSALLTEFMSNAAVVAMLLPPVFSIAAGWGVDLRAATMAVVLPSNFAFMMPIATPATALAWSAGYYTPREVAKNGFAMNLAGFASVLLLVLGWWPLIGIL
ncbi:MAG: SLC13/DASS family transporter [Deltaproteobacteria bacterium]|nr:MAG: SLC13/DASS family transporter [Deltaproteobacteria bacterium]